MQRGAAHALRRGAGPAAAGARGFCAAGIMSTQDDSDLPVVNAPPALAKILRERGIPNIAAPSGREGARQSLDTETRSVLGQMQGLLARARRGAQTKGLEDNLQAVLMDQCLASGGGARAALDEAALRRDGASPADLRWRRELAWENILERGTDAAGIGWCLRGYYRDHVRLMNLGELREFEAVLLYKSEELAAFLEMEHKATPRRLTENEVYCQMKQYYRYWRPENTYEYR